MAEVLVSCYNTEGVLMGFFLLEESATLIDFISQIADSVEFKEFSVIDSRGIVIKDEEYFTSLRYADFNVTVVPLRDEYFVANCPENPEPVISPNENQTHDQITCTFCEKRIRKELYQCMHCEKFLLCPECETFNEIELRFHDASHVFVKLYPQQLKEYGSDFGSVKEEQMNPRIAALEDSVAELERKINRLMKN
mmetsp:Transcript_106586/g.159459  ORF Transcript_106586/g.159459 Transcript_106586/m.159459 type:complete len:195 (-) Transcript_106586:12-596(-)